MLGLTLSGFASETHQIKRSAVDVPARPRPNTRRDQLHAFLEGLRYRNRQPIQTLADALNLSTTQT